MPETDFIATVHPYDCLPQHELVQVAAAFSRRFFPAEDEVYHYGDALPSLYLIESGKVLVTDRYEEPVSELGPRNSFGERGLLRDGKAVTSAHAIADSVILTLPKDILFRLIADYRAFARFFDRREAITAPATDMATLRVRNLLTRRPLTCPPDTPIIKAAQMMRDAQISSLGITDADHLTGLVTIRDMANRVVAEGHDTNAPVRQVMTADPVTLPPSALGYDVLNIMLERRIGHLPIIENDRFVGMISQTDLTRVQAISGLPLIHDIAHAASVADIAQATARIPDLLLHLVQAHQRHQVITRMITDIADAATRRLLEMAEERLGPAPACYLWAACGSQGRQEQTGVSDQDNCLILAEGTDPGDPYFESLARFVSDGLNECGYVYCPGGIDRPDPEARMLASVMFDLRGIGGDMSLRTSLQAETLEKSAKNSIFVAHMVANSLGHRPPLGFIGGFATIRSGEHRDHIDMKHNGVVPVTDLARVYALQGRLTPVSTHARLQEAEAQRIISGNGARDLIAAYDLIQTVRLENQAQLVASGRAPDNFIAPADLPDLTHSHLRDAFVVVRVIQSAAGQGKGTLS